MAQSGLECSRVLHCTFPGEVNQRLPGGITSETFSRLENLFPASKAEVNNETANLQTEMANLQAANAKLHSEVAVLTSEKAEEQAELDAIDLQVDRLTPVSASTAAGMW